MPTIGEFTIDKTNFSNLVNNTTTFGEGITEGLKAQGADIGEALGLFVTVIVFIILIVAVLGIVFLFFRFIGSLINKSKGLGKGNMNF